MTFFSRIPFALAVLTGRVAIPDNMTVADWSKAMAFDKVQAQVTALQAALARAQASHDADKAQMAKDVTDEAALNAQLTSAQQALADAEAQITALLQPAVDAANALAPAPTA